MFVSGKFDIFSTLVLALKLPRKVPSRTRMMQFSQTMPNTRYTIQPVDSLDAKERSNDTSTTPKSHQPTTY